MPGRIVTHVPDNIPTPYNEWVEERNGSYGMLIADILETNEREVVVHPNGQSHGNYLV